MPEKDLSRVKDTTGRLEYGIIRAGFPGGVNLLPTEWEIISHINGARTISDIVDLTGKDEFEIAKTIFNLISTGLLQEKSSNRSETLHVSPQVFETLEHELVNAIGPMASIIIDETVEKLGASRGAFPGAKVAALVEKLSHEIKNEEKRLHFSQTMIRFLNDY